MTGEYKIGKDMVGSQLSLINVVLSMYGRPEENHAELVRVVGVPAEI
jgi:hypothetical protein